MSFQPRAASLGELNGGHGVSESGDQTMERCKSSRNLVKKKSFRFGSKNRDEGKKLTRKTSMKSVSNIIQKLVVKMSSVAVQLPSSNGENYTAASNGDLTGGEGASYKKRDFELEGGNQTDNTTIRSNEVFALTGLKNHGNTCFMNAIIQCLAHTDLLAEYFVMGGYKLDLKLRKGQNKRFGTRGEVTDKLAILLKSLWSSQYSAQDSSQFKAIVGKHGIQYRGYAQHDAQEFLLWLLDKIHEDLNRATKRKYKPNKDNCGRSDECIAGEALNNHMRCNDSFVLDLFQAQHRSSLACPKCNQQSTTFDPFVCLSLPIPQRDSRPVYITVVFVGSSRAPFRIGVRVPIWGKISDLCDAVSEMTEIPSDCLIITELNYDGFHRRFQGHQSLSVIQEGDVIYAFEAPKSLYPEPENTSDCPIIVSSSGEGPIQDSIVILLVNCEGQVRNSKRFGPPFVFRVLRELSFEKLQSLFIHAMERILMENIDLQVKKHGLLFRLRVVNGLPGKSYLSHEVDHPLYQATVDSALMCNQDSTGPQHIRMVVEWEPEMRVRCVKATIQDRPDEHNSVREMESVYNIAHVVTLNDCFELYTKDEKLGAEDAWLCPRCKKLQQGTVKKLSLWSLPEVLVVHLKRFRQTSAGRTKLHTLVEFAINDLDMTAHLEPRKQTPDSHSITSWPHWRRHRRSSVSSGEDNVYDLYAVCNHLGTMSGGHYTAYCKNPMDGHWYLYDDTRVEKVSVSQITSKAAYLLFYSRRNVGSSSASESSGSSDHWMRKMPQLMQDSLTSSREELDEEDEPRPSNEEPDTHNDTNTSESPEHHQSRESVALTESRV